MKVWLLGAIGAAAMALGFTAMGTELCFAKSERVDGLNKICYYSCPSGIAAITVKNYELCPLNIKR